MAPRMARQPKSATFTVSGRVRYDEEADCYLSHCPELRIYSAGRTDRDARKALLSAVAGFVEVCAKRGILWRELSTRGVSVTLPAQPIEDDKRFWLQVPLCLVGASSASPQTATA